METKVNNGDQLSEAEQALLLAMRALNIGDRVRDRQGLAGVVVGKDWSCAYLKLRYGPGERLRWRKVEDLTAARDGPESAG